MLQALVLGAALAAQPADPGSATPPSTDEGFVTVRLEVKESGAVEKCTVVETNAPRDFAENVCSIFVTTAKFEPARDDQGLARKTSMTHTIRFKLQD